MTESIAAPEKPNVLNNIFKLAEYVCPEDRFTSAWPRCFIVAIPMEVN